MKQIKWILVASSCVLGKAHSRGQCLLLCTQWVEAHVQPPGSLTYWHQVSSDAGGHVVFQLLLTISATPENGFIHVVIIWTHTHTEEKKKKTHTPGRYNLQLQSLILQLVFIPNYLLKTAQTPALQLLSASINRRHSASILLTASAVWSLISSDQQRQNKQRSWSSGENRFCKTNHVQEQKLINSLLNVGF